MTCLKTEVLLQIVEYDSFSYALWFINALHNRCCRWSKQKDCGVSINVSLLTGGGFCFYALLSTVGERAIVI